LAAELLVDPLVETPRIENLDVKDPSRAARDNVTVLLKPGVMDPVAQSVTDAANDLGIPVESVRTFRRYYVSTRYSVPSSEYAALPKVLANEAIEQTISGPVTPSPLKLGTPYHFKLITVPLRELGEAALTKLSRDNQLSLNPAEMQAIQAHFRTL